LSPIGIGVGHAGEEGTRARFFREVLGHHGSIVGTERAGADPDTNLLERVIKDVSAPGGQSFEKRAACLGIDGSDEIESAGRALPGNILAPGPAARWETIAGPRAMRVPGSEPPAPVWENVSVIQHPLTVPAPAC